MDTRIRIDTAALTSFTPTNNASTTTTYQTHKATRQGRAQTIARRQVRAAKYATSTSIATTNMPRNAR